MIASIASGWAANWFGVIRLPPLLTMGVGVSLLGPVESVAGWYVPLAVIGATPGMAGSLWGVLFSILYGTEHLGAIRSLTMAIGLEITGILIDMGVDFSTQSLFLGLWCAMMVQDHCSSNRNRLRVR